MRDFAYRVSYLWLSNTQLLHCGRDDIQGYCMILVSRWAFMVILRKQEAFPVQKKERERDPGGQAGRQTDRQTDARYCR